MSILLVGLSDEVTEATAKRLIAQGDEVRVLIPDRAGADALRAKGVHPAIGDVADDDLVERAAQNVRTIVFGPPVFETDDALALFEGGAKAGVGRWIYVAPFLETDVHVLERLRTLPEYVYLAAGKKSLIRRKVVIPGKLAEAIDAADDLAGELRLEVDLTHEAGWRALKLEPPES